MPKRLRRLAVLVFLAASLPAGRTSAEPATPAVLGRVRLTVVAPDGTPAAGALVRLAPAESSRGGGDAELNDPPPPARADADGGVELAWPAGVHQLRVLVPGVGFAVTGQATVPAEGVGEVPLPRLAPFARYSGMIGDELTLDADFALLADDGRGAAYPATLDGRRFTVEVPAAESYRLVARRAGRLILDGSERLPARPGDVTDGLVFPPPPSPDPPAATPPAAEEPEPRPKPAATSQPDPRAPIQWVRGTVRDKAGRPMSGVTVYCNATFSLGIRMGRQVAATNTLHDGTYSFSGEGSLQSFSATLVAKADDRPPAFAYFRLPEPEYDRRTNRRLPTPAVDVVRDICLPGQGGRLEVTVLDADGRRAADVPVRLLRDGELLGSRWAAPVGDRELHALLDAITTPSGRTYDDGTVRFSGLVPGVYAVDAGPETDSAFPREFDEAEDHRPSLVATSVGVAVRAGETARHAMTLRPLPEPVRFAVHQQDGKPLVGTPAFVCNPAADVRGGTSYLELDADGHAAAVLGEAGLWHVSFDYRTLPVREIPTRPPVNSAETVVAASAVLGAGRHRVEVVARKVSLGTVTVTLLDDAGRPARGVVGLGFFTSEPTSEGVGSTDDDGRITFDGVPQYKMSARSVAAADAPLRPDGDGPLPGDDRLAGKTFVPPVEVHVAADEHADVTLRRLPAGYVRGRAALDATAGSYRAVWSTSAPIDSGQAAFDVSAGQLVAGPFADGEAVSLGIYRGDDEVFRGEAKAVGGKVVTVELKPAPPVPAEQGEQPSTILGVGGAMGQQDADALTGRVTLADGATPAYGATLLYFPPSYPAATVAGVVGADGKIGGRSPWYALPDGEEIKVPDVGRLVALLPGRTGATVLELTNPADAPPQITLPPAIDAGGTVTVGGRPPSAWAGRVRVLAVPQVDDPRLAGPLSLWATPEPDGAFTLRGLTPGRTYRMQAALDEIWLSESATLDVADAAAPAVLKLTIGEPAGGAVVTVLDAAGKPAAGARVTVDRPAGPLADATWPRAFVTDGAGRAVVPALERGTHRLRLAAFPEVAVEVVAAPLGAAATEVEVRLPEPGR